MRCRPTRDGTVYDYVGGLADLDARRVRFIGDPQKRIEEDYLRILRFFRFHAAYGDGGHPDAEGLAACIAGRDGLDQLSRERVRMEMMKLVVAPHAVPTLIAMADAGLLLRVLGGVSYLGVVREHGQGRGGDRGWRPTPVRRLGALAVVVAEDAERLWQKLRLTNAEHERLASMAEGWRRISPAVGRAGGARAALSAAGRSISPTTRCSPGRARRRRAHDAGLARARDPAAALDRAGVSVEGGGFHRAASKRPGAGAALAAAEEAWIAAGFRTIRKT